MLCNNCGNDVTAGAFCEVCGAALPQTEQVTQTASPAATPSKGKSITALVLGIISLAGSLGIPIALPTLVNLACGIVAIILGGKENKLAKESGASNGMAQAGLYMGWGGVIVTAVSTVLSVLLVGIFLVLYVLYFLFIFFAIRSF